MGFQDKTLLPLLISLASGAIRESMPWPEILMLDLMCHLHQMGSMEATPVELWNYIMEPIRRHLNNPYNKTKTVWISVDKRYVPKLKQNTTKARDSRAANETKGDGQGEEKKSTASSLPYPPHTQVDEYGRVIFVRLLSTTTNSAPHYEVAGWPEGNKLVLSRLCSSRELRYKVFLYMFTKLAPLESKNLPKGTRLIISFSDDQKVSPVVVTSNQDEPLGPFFAKDRLFFYNSWPEADHDQPFGLKQLLEERRKDPQRGLGPVSVLACSVDGDMYGIWSMFIDHPRNSVWVNGGLQLYFWNMNPVKGGPNAKTVDMVQFVKNVRKYGVHADALSLFKLLMGNDYTDRKALMPRVSAEKAWPRFVRALDASKNTVSSITDSVHALRKFLIVLATDESKGRVEKSVLEAAKNESALKSQLERVSAGLRLCRLCFCEVGPRDDDDWLRPVKTGVLDKPEAV